MRFLPKLTLSPGPLAWTRSGLLAAGALQIGIVTIFTLLPRIAQALDQPVLALARATAQRAVQEQAAAILIVLVPLCLALDLARWILTLRRRSAPSPALLS
ncbi:hypothetical protein LAZ40_09800 [Cereibacter sphaeroides]|uniref:hypothetical protein n=1 Tax=Cereibacter sphaeroides TaxID=1063 RepID=UPI001F46073E|nr:hypothetical protein [Cereibacter sphaeroides]MCE6959344.1 hypothetical protein [Cereibacter sphaeroides]MCE6972936.1 hypothetical protein [Cereibacter sphaeroides]